MRTDVIVCLCEGVTSATIDAAIRAGASTVREVARATGAGTDCGSCACDVRARVRACRREETPVPVEARAVASK